MGDDRGFSGALAVLAEDESFAVVILHFESLRHRLFGDLHHAPSWLGFAERGRTAATALPLWSSAALPALCQTSCIFFSSGIFSLRISASSRKPFAPAYLPASPSLLCQNVLSSPYFSETFCASAFSTSAIASLVMRPFFVRTMSNTVGARMWSGNTPTVFWIT